MPFKPGREPIAPDYKRLLSTLNDSKVRERDTPLYEVVKRLIDWGQQQNTSFGTQIASINQSISEISITSSGGGGDGDDEPSEPAAITGYYEPVTNGNPTYPELLFDSNGEVIMGFVSLV